MRMLLFILLLTLVSYDTDGIYLANASFEGEPQDATVPAGWMPCAIGTTPDILPGAWGVYTEASDGDTYIGLITRPDLTYESIGQRLTTALESGECYSLSLDLARSNTYAGYNESLKLRVWGAEQRCDKAQLLYESPLINHTDWQNYRLDFFTEQQCNYLIFEAYAPNEKPTKGNILLDNCSVISLCKRA